MFIEPAMRPRKCAGSDSGRTEQHQELSMNPVTATNVTPVLDFEAANWVATAAMLRDQEQSRRLHEPAYMNNSIDPITGRDIKNLATHPYLNDGMLTIYFESEETRQAYMDTPVDHPFGKLPGKPSEEDDRGG
jgi:Ulp1 family protease